jgi:hypothetical protein
MRKSIYMETTQTTAPELKSEQKTKCCHGACKSRTFKIIACLIGSFLIALVIFAGGVAVGLHKARFSNEFGKNYERNFMGSRFEDRSEGRGGFGGGMMNGLGGMMRGFNGGDFLNGHGLSGTIISIADNNLVIKDRDGKENSVAVKDNTIIKSRRDDLKLSDLKQNDQVVVIGNPGDNGVVNATLIRVFDNNGNN